MTAFRKQITRRKARVNSDPHTPARRTGHEPCDVFEQLAQKCTISEQFLILAAVRSKSTRLGKSHRFNRFVHVYKPIK